jgi:lipooligosaccharide transport system permease protein
MATLALRSVERSARVYRHLWRGDAFSSFVSPLLYLGAMGIGLGGLVDARSQGVDGLTYLQFVTPGLLVATALQMAAGDSLWGVMAGTKWIRHFHAMVAAPLGPTDVYLGSLGWTAIRLTAAATVFLFVATLLGGVLSAGAVLAIPFAVLTAAAVAACLMAYAAGQEEDGNFGLIMRLLVLPLFLFSGTFFPVDQLPAGLRPFVWLSPLWHGIELARAATTGRWDALGPVLVAVHLSLLTGLLVLGAVVGGRAFTRRLTR